MNIRAYRESDLSQIVSLFYETVHSVNKQDYSQEQLDAWAPKEEEALKLNTWRASLRQNITYVAEIDNIIVGFSDMTAEGHLDRLYVHKDYQGQGVASALVNKFELKAKEQGLYEMDTEASITAKPFFERLGYQVIAKQSVERKGVLLVNYRMSKKIM
ncbi:GNAT family N-acetyltransferase [Paenibacillus odorifer]|uniref:GNAT family N-acetyltransferase n=1 Tax=Paenibacillus TaxID=44249 RepID=UPI00096EA50D|nr:GNAT family N-acetyltransferase [Paenibacillus odorifer]OMC75797.1 GNAT family N-acetyltransferase [Paenibacillus odorifer]OMC80843.1 GNAT family N-acetyltransferase [Paenibacillus odorifer]OMD77753.1 GNAT family N-acetyltransferase [Paenibacillus odorifer]OMD93231.1 GNAT family N-acetyltransferase [Paenibacillus odorifer]OMD93429.1 GNAT family N-acetyltransferase [Paenibacillus odorifer]